MLLSFGPYRAAPRLIVFRVIVATVLTHHRRLSAVSLEQILHTAEDSVGKDVKTLRRALKAEFSRVPPARPGAAALVALCGLPGTGKSHFAAALARRVPCLTLGSDRIRKILTPQPRYTGEEHARVFTAAHALLEQLLRQGYRVIFDATNLSERARQPLHDIAARVGVRLILVQFYAPPNLVRQRLARRARGQAFDSYSDADWRIYCRLYPGQEPVAGRHFKVDTSRSIEPALTRLTSRLRQTGQ